MPSTFRGEQTLNAQVGNYITETPNCPKIWGGRSIINEVGIICPPPGWNMYFKSGGPDGFDLFAYKTFYTCMYSIFSKIKYIYYVLQCGGRYLWAPLFEVHAFFF